MKRRLRFFPAASLALFAAVSQAFPASLVLHLRLDDGPGSTTATDSSGNGLDAPLINMDPNNDWVAGIDGIALDFDGINDHVIAPDNALLHVGPGDFTVSFWVLKQSSAASNMNIFGVGKWRTSASPGLNEWLLTVGSGGSTDIPAFAVEIAGTSYSAVSTGAISIGVWHHLAGVREGNVLRLYVDGILEAENSSLPVGGSLGDTSAGLAVAANQQPAFQFFTDAVFDDIQIYDYALSDGGAAVGGMAGGDIGFLFANPGLTVTASPGMIPPTLTVELTSPTEITLSWSVSGCSGVADYGIYEGEIGVWYSHSPVPGHCTDTIPFFQETIAFSPGDRYYLVVPNNPLVEGSYGLDSSGAERPPGTVPCAAFQQLGCP